MRSGGMPQEVDMAEEATATNGQEQDAQQNTPPAEETNQTLDAQQEQDAPLTWDSWFGEQGDEVKALIDTHTSGLKSALDSERQQRRDFEKQLKTLGKQAEEGSELRKSLDALGQDIEKANARADFYEMAADPSLGLRDAKLAWALISANPDDFTRRGKPDFDALKEAHPVLFETPKPNRPPTNSGQGTQNPAPNKSANELMNDFIRAGRGG
jgi:hypothetical protein